MSNLTEADLEKMGLRLNPKTGRYEKSNGKADHKTDNPTYSIDWISAMGDPTAQVLIEDLPVKFTVGKKDYYATAQAFYSGVHYRIRRQIKNQAKAFLSSYIRELDKLKPGSVIIYIFSVKRKVSPKIDLDIDNRGYFWDKIFSDALEEYKLVPKDNVYFMPTKIYHFNNEVKRNQLQILIYSP